MGERQKSRTAGYLRAEIRHDRVRHELITRHEDDLNGEMRASYIMVVLAMAEPNPKLEIWERIIGFSNLLKVISA